MIENRVENNQGSFFVEELSPISSYRGPRGHRFFVMMRACYTTKASSNGIANFISVVVRVCSQGIL